MLHSCISLSLLLSLAASPALGIRTPKSVSGRDAQFPLVEQPLMRIGMTLGGFALIGLLIASVIDASERETEKPHQGASFDQQPV